MSPSALPATAGRLGNEPRHQNLVGGAPRSGWDLPRDLGEGALGVGEPCLCASQADIGSHDLPHLLPQRFTFVIRLGSAEIRSDRRTRHARTN